MWMKNRGEGLSCEVLELVSDSGLERATQAQSRVTESNYWNICCLVGRFIFLGSETSVEELPPSDWRGHVCGHFLDWWWVWKGPAHCGSSLPTGSPEFVRRLSKPWRADAPMACASHSASRLLTRAPILAFVMDSVTCKPKEPTALQVPFGQRFITTAEKQIRT